MDPSLIPQAEKALTGEIIIQKKNKKGKLVEKEISAGIHSLSFESGQDGTILQAVLSVSGENYLKPETLLGVLKERLGEASFEEVHILRTNVYKSDLTPF